MPLWRRKWRVEDVVASQQAMNRQTWDQLKAHGVGEGTPLRLEFFYEPPSRSRADELAEFLRRERNYEVQARADMVTGWTEPTSTAAASSTAGAPRFRERLRLVRVEPAPRLAA